MLNPLIKQVEELHTIIDFIRYGITCANNATLYYGHGTDNASDDIFSLILASLKLPVDSDPQLLHSRLTQQEKDYLALKLKERIVDHVPVPYLIKQAQFCDLPFYVDERVLIPRSPIAELIKQQFTPWVVPEEVGRILDLCTGSACIAIACAYAFPDATIDAVDLSPEALAVAAINCERLQVQDRVNLIHSDCWQNVPAARYDIIVTNPPYVGHEEMQTLPAEYLHEPAMALEAEKNGLAIVEKILSNAHHYLTEQGILVVEVGNSEEAVAAAFPELPFLWLEFAHGGQGVFLLNAETLRDYFAQ